MELPEDNNIDVLIEEPLGDINRMYVRMYIHSYILLFNMVKTYANNKLGHLF